jgi:hypothetical protein
VFILSSSPLHVCRTGLRSLCKLENGSRRDGLACAPPSVILRDRSGRTEKSEWWLKKTGYIFFRSTATIRPEYYVCKRRHAGFDLGMKHADAYSDPYITDTSLRLSFTEYQSISKSLSKSHSLNHHLDTHVYKYCFLYFSRSNSFFHDPVR